MVQKILLFFSSLAILAGSQVTGTVENNVTNDATTTPSSIRLTNEIEAIPAGSQVTRAVEYNVTNDATITPAGIRFINYSMQVLNASTSFIWDIFYNVTNDATTTPGGIRFTNEIGLNYSMQVLNASTSFIWEIFQQNYSTADKKNVSKVTLYIDTMDGVAYTSNDGIHVSANYIQDYSGDVKKEITGVLYHEMTHVWQWDGNGQTPGGLIEGIADFVRLKAGYAPSHWVKPGQGDRWDQGYDVTARFLDYCNDLSDFGFVAELNKKMRSGYSDDYFVDLLGKTVDQLWSDYKAKYTKT